MDTLNELRVVGCGRLWFIPLPFDVVIPSGLLAECAAPALVDHIEVVQADGALCLIDMTTGDSEARNNVMIQHARRIVERLQTAGELPVSPIRFVAANIRAMLAVVTSQ
jgi:hypothetical protein